MRWNLVWQPMVAVMMTTFFLFAFSMVASSPILWAVGAGSLASSTCIVFATPKARSARAQSILGGYIIAIFVGELIHYLQSHFGLAPGDFITPANFKLIGYTAGLSVGVSMLLMGVLGLEHPPAVGMSLVLVLDLRDFRTLLVVVSGAFILTVTRQLLNRNLKDLSQP